MFSALTLHSSSPSVTLNRDNTLVVALASGRPSGVRLPARRFSSLSLQSENASSEPPISSSSRLTSSVGSSPAALQLSTWNITPRHITVLNVMACATAVSATWLLCSAIPTLLAFKRAAESLEKLLDVTREELPGTMAAIRLSGMEISDLTMELSDLGQEITQGVRSSTRAVRVAEERLRRLTNMAPPGNTALVQVANHPKSAADPVLARTAKGIREGIVKGRAILQAFFTLTRFSRLAINYFADRAKQ